MKPLTREKFLTTTEVEQLFTNLATAPKRDRVLFELLYATGARSCELLKKHLELDHQRKSIKITGAKGSLTRELPLKPKLFTELVELCAATDGVPFNIGYDRFHSLWNYYRPVKKTSHSLRHTRAYLVQDNSNDLKVTQYVLGHVNINNTTIYLTKPPEMSYLRKALK